MEVYRIYFWIVIFGSCNGDFTFNVISASKSPLMCILDGEDLAVIMCTTPPPSPGYTFVEWKKNDTAQALCLNTEDKCEPQSRDRYNFTSDYLRNHYLFHIANVSLEEDQTTYTCAQGAKSKNINISVCKVPTNLTITESGVGVVTLTGKTDCVYPETDVTIEWIYVSASTMDAETSLDLTPTRSSETSDCQHGARKVTSSIQQIDATGNTVKVFFRVKVSHPAIAETIQATSKNTYLIKKVTDDGPRNLTLEAKLAIGFGCMCVLAITVVAVLVCWKKKKNDVQSQTKKEKQKEPEKDKVQKPQSMKGTAGTLEVSGEEWDSRLASYTIKVQQWNKDKEKEPESQTRRQKQKPEELSVVCT